MKKEKIPTHKHVKMPNHSIDQERMFFGLVGTLGYDIIEAKERAKKRFNVGCFNALSSTQINHLIEKLLEKQDTKRRNYEEGR